MNNKIKNREFSYKKEYYSDGCIQYCDLNPELFMDESTWDSKTIERRTTVLVDSIVKTWKKIMDDLIKTN